jgi:GAF domain-containing protein
MQARLIAYPPEQAAIIRTARPGERVRIGRGADNELVLQHASISRQHAELLGFDTGWQLRDIGSKNGTFVEGRPAEVAALTRPCWLRFGDVHCEFGLLSDEQLAAEEQGRAERRSVATAHTAARWSTSSSATCSMRACGPSSNSRNAIVASCSWPRTTTSACAAARRLDPALLPDRAFSGSVGAVKRALAERRAVVANDVAHDAYLAQRDSVIAHGLRALLCLPLLEGDRTLGAIYADRIGAGPAITTLDLELLQAFAEHAAVWIAARHAKEQLAQDQSAPQPDVAPRWSRIVAAAEVA